MKDDDVPEDDLGELPIMLCLKKSSAEIQDAEEIKVAERAQCASVVEAYLGHLCTENKAGPETTTALLKAASLIRSRKSFGNPHRSNNQGLIEVDGLDEPKPG